jgi:hypothetical protein
MAAGSYARIESTAKDKKTGGNKGFTKKLHVGKVKEATWLPPRAALSRKDCSDDRMIVLS